MIFINPQWQGSGYTDEIKRGAENLIKYFKTDLLTIPLSDKELTTVDNIIGFYPIVEQIENFRQILLNSRLKKVATIGGDCGIEVIPISYLNKIYDNNIFVIWFDAHADLNTPDSSPSKTFHGMPLRTLLNEGNSIIKQKLFSFIKPNQICFAGLRDLDEAEVTFIKSNKINSLESPDYNAIETIIKRNGYNKVYIHLDLDVLDQKEFKHTMFPSDNGFRAIEVADTIKKLKNQFEVVGICITESTATTLDDLEPIKQILDQVRI